MHGSRPRPRRAAPRPARDTIGVVDLAEQLASLTPLDGGWSGQTFVAEGPDGRHVVRIYAEPGPRGEHAQDVDAALLRLVRGLVPVPEVLEVRRPDVASGLPGLLVTSFVAGERGDLLLPRQGEEGRAALGRRIGALVASLGAMAQPRAGAFVDGALRVATWAHADGGLEAFVEEHAERLDRWNSEELVGLRAVAETAQDLLDTVERVCLVHGDLNPKNWLADPETLAVTALVDWEFAHAGHPAFDLGNALRFHRQPAYVDGVLDAYTERLGGDAGEHLDLARAADLWALVDLAARRGANPVTERADRLLRAIARTRDLHAVD